MQSACGSILRGCGRPKPGNYLSCFFFFFFHFCTIFFLLSIFIVFFSTSLYVKSQLFSSCYLGTMWNLIGHYLFGIPIGVSLAFATNLKMYPYSSPLLILSLSSSLPPSFSLSSLSPSLPLPPPPPSPPSPPPPAPPAPPPPPPPPPSPPSHPSHPSPPSPLLPLSLSPSLPMTWIDSSSLWSLVWSSMWNGHRSHLIRSIEGRRGGGGEREGRGE